MSGHLTCTATLSRSRHISTLNYLRSADTCLKRTRPVICWLSVPANDSANKCLVFGVHINPKSLAARTLCSFHNKSSCRKSHIFCVKPVMSKKITILSFDQCASCRRLLSSWCGKTQIARFKTNRVATKSHHGRVEFGRPASQPA